MAYPALDQTAMDPQVSATRSAFGNSNFVNQMPSAGKAYSSAFSPSAGAAGANVGPQANAAPQGGGAAPSYVSMPTFNSPQAATGVQPVTSQNQPGYAETNFTRNADQYVPQPGVTANIDSQIAKLNGPTPSSDHWDGVSGSFNTSGTFNNPNNSQLAFNQTNAANPGSLQGDFNTSYDLALQKALGTANAQSAARGAYGGSAALNGVDSVIAQNAADRANAQNQFSLQNSQNMLNWQNTLGQQGQAADTSALNAFQGNLNGMSTYSQMAHQATADDTARIQASIAASLGVSTDQLQRLIGGQNAAGSAQNAFQGRSQNVTAAQTALQQQIQDYIDKHFGGVNNAEDPSGADNAAVGAATNAANQGDKNVGEVEGDIGKGAGIATGVVAAGNSGAPAYAPMPSQPTNNPLFQTNPSF